MSAQPLPVPGVPVAPEAKPYWEAAREGRLRLQRCPSCESFVWYPRGTCPTCGSNELQWVESPGHGSVYSFAILRRGDGAFKDAAPYVLAYVELDEGPRVLTNVVGCPVDEVTVGMRVVARFDRGQDEAVALRFEPAGIS